MKKIAVIGAGTMGNGIAHTFAQKNYQVTLIDVSKQSLEKALSTISKNLDRMVSKEKISESEKSQTLANIQTSSEINKDVLSDTDLVVEAATENLDIKLKIFENLDNSKDKSRAESPPPKIEIFLFFSSSLFFTA